VRTAPIRRAAERPEETLLIEWPEGEAAQIGRRPGLLGKWLPLTLMMILKEGALLSYAPDPVDLYRRAASYVDRILRGERPGDLPVQLATKFEMVLNLKTAKALGLAVPASVLLRATEVIE
jgi:hypothetical protein